MRSSLNGGLMFVAILAVGLVLAACGSSSNSSTTTTALSKAEFQKKANAICAKGNKATNQVAAQTFSKNKKPTTSQITQFTTKVVPLVQQQIDGIKALGAPAGGSAKVNAITSDAQAALDKVKSDPTAFLHGDPFKKANQEAKAYGLTACGGGGNG
jgi:hypothetical protein